MPTILAKEPIPAFLVDHIPSIIFALVCQLKIVVIELDNNSRKLEIYY